MAYYRKNFKSGRNRNNRFNDRKEFNVERTENRPQIDDSNNTYTFDGSRYKKKDIKIVDLGGNVYIIPQGATIEWAIANYKSLEGFAELENSKFDIDKFQDVYNALKQSVLALINLNREGATYDMTQINMYFNDASMMCDLVKYVMDISQNEIPKN